MGEYISIFPGSLGAWATTGAGEAAMPAVTGEAVVLPRIRSRARVPEAGVGEYRKVGRRDW